MCRLANIEAEKISGQCKNGTHPKQELRKVPKSDHAWNRVKISGSWYFVDSTWCAGSVGENNISIACSFVHLMIPIKSDNPKLNSRTLSWRKCHIFSILKL